MQTIVTIFGTRPEAIKMAPVIIKLRAKSKELRTIVCVTAQHREMLDQVLDIFQIRPDYDLGIMKQNQSLFDVTVNGLKKLENILKKEKPDIILVQGDTTTTFIASLAAYYLKIKIGHIEAGLRTKDKFNPFPEEINRRLTDCLADLYFVHTKQAKENLLREGVDKRKIFLTGNTVIDALQIIVKKQNNKKIQKEIEQRFFLNYGISFDNKKLILVTGHRRESFGRDFENICKGLKKIALSNQDIQIIYPVHLNPNVQNPVRKILSGMSNVHLIEPLDYFTFVWLMNRAYLILTDSGGIQEEAPSLGKPVLVMRKKTERTEGIEAGTAKLVGTDSEKIYSEVKELLENIRLYQKMSKAVNPYGDGKAAERIVERLAYYDASLAER
ncbi:MAG: UDP-N-acetylglucosamine 2-epimerase (non-hydrolyzing) [Thermodesulfovibrionales bacterium]